MCGSGRRKDEEQKVVNGKRLETLEYGWEARVQTLAMYVGDIQFEPTKLFMFFVQCLLAEDGWLRGTEVASAEDKRKISV